MIIALDGGTTNTRARLLDGHRLVASASRPVGARDVAAGKSREVLERAVAEAMAEVFTAANLPPSAVLLVCASGMLTSNVGLAELEHVLAPAGRDNLARQVASRSFPAITPQPIHFVRGVKVGRGDDPLFPFDMMRGEECECFGLLELRRIGGPIALVLPGSHTKLVTIDSSGRITDLRTSLTGEMIDALARHTVLSGSVPSPLPESLDTEAVLQAAKMASSGGLLQSAFAVRVAQVLQGRDRDACAAMLVGAVLGSDVAGWIGAGLLDVRFPLLVGGRQPLRGLYASLLRDRLGDAPLVQEATDAEVQLASAVGAKAIVELSLTRTISSGA